MYTLHRNCSFQKLALPSLKKTLNIFVLSAFKTLYTEMITKRYIFLENVMKNQIDLTLAKILMKMYSGSQLFVPSIYLHTD